MASGSRRLFLAQSASAAFVWGASAPEVVVYGGVPCGIAAALAAARAGRRVLLIEPTRHIGGLSTSGINTAESEHMLHWTIGGLANEFYERLGQHYGTGRPEYYFESSVAEKTYLDMLSEAKVEIRYGVRVTDVKKSGARIVSLTLSDGSTVTGRVFIDAGYEGDLMARAGVSSTFGRESRSEYGEDAAGIRFDQLREAKTVDANGRLLPGLSAWRKDLPEGSAHRAGMNYNFRLTFAKDPSLRVPIPGPAHYDRGRYALLANYLTESRARQHKLTDFLDLYARRHGKFEVNNKHVAIISMGHFGGQFDYPSADYAERDRIVADHWDYTLGLLHFLGHDDTVPENVRQEMRGWGLHRDEFTDNRHLPYQLYVREARRMKGEYIVTQRDVTTDRHKADSIGLSSHFIDSHPVQRVAVSPTALMNEGRIWRLAWAYQIPYRTLVPKRSECTNLLVPGAASFSHVGFCTYRLESVWMIGGHAAGTAAAQAVATSKSVQQIDLPRLQASLRQQKQVIDFVPGQPEKWSDPRGGTGGIPEF